MTHNITLLLYIAFFSFAMINPVNSLKIAQGDMTRSNMKRKRTMAYKNWLKKTFGTSFTEMHGSYGGGPGHDHGTVHSASNPLASLGDALTDPDLSMHDCVSLFAKGLTFTIPKCIEEAEDEDFSKCSKYDKMRMEEFMTQEDQIYDRCEEDLEEDERKCLKVVADIAYEECESQLVYARAKSCVEQVA